MKLTTILGFFYLMIIIYSDHQLRQIKNYKCRSKVKQANSRFEENITLFDLLKVLEKFKFRCFYCNDPLPPKTWQLDHFFSRAMKGKNLPDNLAPSCKWCNQMKNALCGNSFIDRCQKIVLNNFFAINEMSTPLGNVLKYKPKSI